jgi:hypothetical protein
MLLLKSLLKQQQPTAMPLFGSLKEAPAAADAGSTYLNAALLRNLP